MKDIYRDILSVWGALIATILAIIQIVRAYRDKPNIKVDAGLVFSPAREDQPIKGTRIFVKDEGFRDVIMRVTAANHGKQPIQIIGVILEEESTNTITIIQVLPEKLPAVLDPSTLLTVEIQKEWLDMIKTTLFGVIDALGNRHSVSNDKLGDLIKQCEGLPGSKSEFARKDNPEEVVQAYQMTDPVLITVRKKKNKTIDS